MSKDMLYRAVLRGFHESPSFGGNGDQSPMSSLASSLLGANLDGTPRKRLSLSSTLSSSATPNGPDLGFFSPPDNPSCFNIRSSCQDNSPISPNQIGASPRNKENIPASYYSPSQSQFARYHLTPLREIQNTATRNLTFSPLKQTISPSRREHLSPVKIPTPPDECDSNSRDSGYSESGQKKDVFNVPRACAPTRRLNLDMPPQCSPFKSPTSEGLKARSFSSLNKKSEEDDAFLLEFICGADEPAAEENETSLAFSSLLSAPIQSSQSPLARVDSGSPRLPIRRCLSMIDASTPVSSVINSQYKPSWGSSQMKSFKRPASPCESLGNAKRKRTDSESTEPETKKFKTSIIQPTSFKWIPKRQISEPEATVSSKPLERPVLPRCHSESHVSIMKALNKSANHVDNLTGDFSQALSLPVIQGGKHPDLKAISIHTLASVVRGDFKDKFSSVRILDCRYPYEYDGGHVANAENWYHPKMIYDLMQEQVSPPEMSSSKPLRQILIFHCEFSAERAPRAQRMLREIDRATNKDRYPALHFPEMYLLEGGYKAFYEVYPELCTPLAYVKMLDEKHTEDFKHFRSKSKSWAAENRQGKCAVSRTGPKRLGL